MPVSAFSAPYTAVHAQPETSSHVASSARVATLAQSVLESVTPTTVPEVHRGSNSGQLLPPLQLSPTTEAADSLDTQQRSLTPSTVRLPPLGVASAEVSPVSPTSVIV